VSVVVPFRGDNEEAGALISAVKRLAVEPGDEILLVDNTRDSSLAMASHEGPVVVISALVEQSSYYARNVGAAEARNDWLLFIDADCRPAPELLDAFFRRPIEESCGLLPGRIVAATDQSALIARYASSRGLLDQSYHVDHPYRPSGATANLLVRRAAWEAVGGFHEGVRSGADVEFCWRVQDAGWTLDYRDDAVVEHRHRERLGALVRQSARYGAGCAWVNRRFPGALERPKLLRPLLRCAAGVIAWTLGARPQHAAFKAIDAVWVLAQFGGYLLSNRAAQATSARRKGLEVAEKVPVVIFTDLFPALSETFVANEVRALRRAGHHVRVEASVRAPRPERSAGRELEVTYLEDDSIASKLLGLLQLAARHPLRSLGDQIQARRWSREEEVWPLNSLAPVVRRLTARGDRHIHVHFAGPAALNALRVTRLVGVPYSVTAHARDIFQFPTNLAEKLESASFTTTGCKYNENHLRMIVGPDTASRIHQVVMGVDGGRFRRRSAYPGSRSLVAVGRLVEKKGFAYLLEAAALLQGPQALDRLVIIGEGPLRHTLEELTRRLGLESTVALPGWREPDGVIELLEEADVLAMPSVVAADGDRDSMPVVVKEALAMEVPVVATRDVGLPEVVREEWGRLVAPRDPRSLAAAVAELLALPAETRAAMGRRGREWVLEEFDVDRQTAKVSRLIGDSGQISGTR